MSVNIMPKIENPLLISLYSHYVEKYERLEKRRNSYAAHNPPCIDAQEGDMVKIMECRPLAKSKSFVVVQKIEG